MRRARIAIAALALCLLVAVGGVWALLRAARAERSGTLSFSGLDAEVEIRFDARARPFVHARSRGDALFALGVLHVHERLFQMELLSRVGRGRLAEALGASLLETDRALWRMGVPQLARRLEQTANAETRRIVDHYVAGVNAAMNGLRSRPPEMWLTGMPPRRWTARDVHALGAAMAFSSANNADEELLRLAIASAVGEVDFDVFLPAPPADGFPYMVPPGVRSGALEAAWRHVTALTAAEKAGLRSLAFGSNGWAVAGARTQTGRALLAFDSHDALSLPNLHYEVHLFFEADDGAPAGSIRGFSVPGLPGVINGFNDHIAWGFTNIGDSQDLFVETAHPDDPTRFAGPQGWYEAERERISIPVAGAEPDTLIVVRTRNGPLIQEDPPISIAWSGHHAGEAGLGALFALNVARSYAEASAALDRLDAPSANATIADDRGRIAVRTVGLLPVRARGEGLVPLPGDAPDVAWTGFIPMDRLPRSVDPARGWVAAANARVNAPGDGPLVSADNAPGYRMDRIATVLEGSSDHDVASMQRLQMDWDNGQARRLLPRMLEELGPRPIDPASDAAREILEAWARAPQSGPDLSAPLIFQRWYIALAEALFAERLGPDVWPRLLKQSYVLNQAVDALVLEREATSPWWQAGRSALLRSALANAVRVLEADLGTPPGAWRWGDRHQVVFRHELGRAVTALSPWLGRGPYRWGGDHATVGRARYRYDRPEMVTSGATMRLVVDMSAPPRAWVIMPGGQAGHPDDPHYADQIEPWLAGELDPLPHTWSDTAERSVEVLRLRPAR